MNKLKGNGTKKDPWQLTTPPLNSDYQMYKNVATEMLYCTVAGITLTYKARAIEDLHAMLKERGDWMLLGSCDEQKKADEDTVELWSRLKTNPAKGWYGQTKGFRGRFAAYIPPLLEALGLAELEHKPTGNRIRAIS